MTSMPHRGSVRPESALVALTTLVLVLASGCVSNEESFFIMQNQLPVASGIGSMCTVAADPTAPHTDNGILDLSLATNYILNPLYENQMVSTLNSMIGMPETRSMFVDGAMVSLHFQDPMGPLLFATDATGAMVNMPFTATTSTFINAANNSSPGLATGTLEIVPGVIGTYMQQHFCTPDSSMVSTDCPVPNWNIATNVAQDFVAEITPFGHTIGGINLTGSPFYYPITFCCHCLVEFTSSDDSAANPNPNCSGMNITTVTPPCLFGQDTTVDCSFCSGDTATCQPPGYSPDPTPQMCNGN